MSIDHSNLISSKRLMLLLLTVSPFYQAITFIFSALLTTICNHAFTVLSYCWLNSQYPEMLHVSIATFNSSLNQLCTSSSYYNKFLLLVSWYGTWRVIADFLKNDTFICTREHKHKGTE